MRSKFIIQILILFVFICGCKPMVKDDRHLHHANALDIIIPQADDMDIDSLVAEWDTLRLEAFSESLLSGINKMEVTDDKLYILDGSSSLLFIFNKEGDYINKISNQGQGPREYIRIFDFEVDKINHRILATDAFSKRIFIYDTIGNLQNVIPLNFPPFHISSDISKRLIHLCSTAKDFQVSNLAENNVAILNEEGSIEEAFLKDETPKRLDLIPILSNHVTPDGEILYMPAFSDVIYRIHDTDAIPEYVLDYQNGKKRLTAKDKNEIFYRFDQNNVVEYEKDNYFISDGTFFNSDSLLILPSGFEQRTHTIYSKRHRKSVSINTRHLKGDKALCELVMTCPAAIRDEWIYIGGSGDMAAYLLTLKPENPKIRHFLQSIREDDNPCIIRYKLKSNIFEGS